MDGFTIITIIAMIIVAGGVMFLRNKFGSNEPEADDWGAEARKQADNEGDSRFVASDQVRHVNDEDDEDDSDSSYDDGGGDDGGGDD